MEFFFWGSSRESLWIIWVSGGLSIEVLRFALIYENFWVLVDVGLISNNKVLPTLSLKFKNCQNY
jgi:hypothetical protein